MRRVLAFLGGVLWWLVLYVGFERAIHRKQGPKERRAFQLVVYATCMAMLAGLAYAVYRLIGGGHWFFAAGIIAFVWWRYRLSKPRAMAERAKRRRPMGRTR